MLVSLFRVILGTAIQCTYFLRIFIDKQKMQFDNAIVSSLSNCYAAFFNSSQIIDSQLLENVIDKQLRIGKKTGLSQIWFFESCFVLCIISE